MEDIIKEIIKIDSVAVDTKQKSETALNLRKQSYEEEIRVYKEEVLEAAEKKAKELYDQIVSSGTQEYLLEEEKAKKTTLIIENQYLQIEEALLNNVFNELFLVEG